MTTTTQHTNVYEIKNGRKWTKVRATSMMALNNWAQENKIIAWRMVGMMSIAETRESQDLKVVA